METVSANLHPANRPAKTDNQKYEVSERLLDVGFRWFGIAARMRMVDADDGESLRLRLVDAAAASDLREVVDRRNFVSPRWIGGAITARDRFEDGRPGYVGSGFSRTFRFTFSRPVGAADQQSAAFIRRITPRVRDDRRQRFAIDPDVRQSGPR